MCIVIIILEEIAFLYSLMKAYHYVAQMIKLYIHLHIHIIERKEKKL